MQRTLQDCDTPTIGPNVKETTTERMKENSIFSIYFSHRRRSDNSMAQL